MQSIHPMSTPSLIWRRATATTPPYFLSRELVASFVNRFHLLKSGEKTHACAARILTEHTRNKCCDHAHFHPISATECHAFFCAYRFRLQLSASPMTKASSICTLENSQPAPYANIAARTDTAVLTPAGTPASRARRTGAGYASPSRDRSMADSAGAAR